VIHIRTETICMACCAAVGPHYCGLAWCTHRLCKPELWIDGVLREEESE
jgi:hypothetical protein